MEIKLILNGQFKDFVIILYIITCMNLSCHLVYDFTFASLSSSINEHMFQTTTRKEGLNMLSYYKILTSVKSYHVTKHGFVIGLANLKDRFDNFRNKMHDCILSKFHA